MLRFDYTRTSFYAGSDSAYDRPVFVYAGGENAKMGKIILILPKFCVRGLMFELE